MSYFAFTRGIELRKYIFRDKRARNLLEFIREYKLKKKLFSETFWYIASNMIYSFSTYLVGFLVPYVLNTNLLANYTSGNQVLLLLSFIFEFGLSISFLRFYRIDKRTKYVNSVIQYILFIFLLIVGFFFSGSINKLFNLDELPINSELLYFLVISQLGWIFIKNWMLAANQSKMQMIHAISVFILRMIFLGHLFYLKTFSVSTLFLETLLYPFIPAFLHLLYVNTKTIIEGIPLVRKSGYNIFNIFFKKLSEYLKFSILTYISGFIYLFTGRYFIVYLTGKNNIILADMGYSMVFLGIILVFYTSIRNYLIARLSKNRTEFINAYIKNLKNLNIYIIIGSFLLSLLLAYTVYLVKPHYLTFNAVIFSFILFFTRFYIIYIGLFTLLSKTMDYNKLEVTLNVIRLLLVIVITHTLLLKNVVIGFILINFSQLLVEIIFARILLKRIRYVPSPVH
jgi:hypothetical protein